MAPRKCPDGSCRPGKHIEPSTPTTNKRSHGHTCGVLYAPVSHHSLTGAREQVLALGAVTHRPVRGQGACCRFDAFHYLCSMPPVSPLQLPPTYTPKTATSSTTIRLPIEAPDHHTLRVDFFIVPHTCPPTYIYQAVTTSRHTHAPKKTCHTTKQMLQSQLAIVQARLHSFNIGSHSDCLAPRTNPKHHYDRKWVRANNLPTRTGVLFWFAQSLALPSAFQTSGRWPFSPPPIFQAARLSS